MYLARNYQLGTLFSSRTGDGTGRRLGGHTLDLNFFIQLSIGQ